MPGYVIHLAVAEEYLKKHGNKEKYNNFIEGVIFPDSVKDKSLTHYGPGSSYSNLKLFLEDKKDMKDDFTRGYFEHLLTDYLFYNKYIDTFSKAMYDDYDLLNSYLIEKYKPEVLAIEELFYFKNQKTVIPVAEARGVILLTCQKYIGKIYEYTPLQIKQALTGVGRAEKAQVQFMVKTILGLKAIPKPDDAADALAVALCHSQTSPRLNTNYV